MEKAVLVAEAYNRVVSNGGRPSPDQHLQDLARERQSTELLQRARQRGFTTPQADYNFRQQEIRQAWQRNYANWGGYATQEQYLQSLARERQGMEALGAALKRRAEITREQAEASTKLANATQGTHLSTGQVADQAGRLKASLSSVGDVRSLMTDLQRQIAGRNLPGGQDPGASAVVAQLATIRKALQDVRGQQGVSGLSVAPRDLGKAEEAFKSLQAYAARSYDEIDSRQKQSGSKFEQVFSRMRSLASDTWRSVAEGSRLAASEGGNAFDRLGSRVKGAFSGLGGGGGIGGLIGGIADAFGSLAASVPGKVQLIAGAVLALIQILPALSAGLGAVAAVAATLPDLMGAMAGAFVTFQAAIMPVIEALQKYVALVQAQEAAQAGGLSNLMQQQAAVHSLADAQFALSQAVVQGNNQQVTSAHAVADAQFSLKQAYFSAAMTQVQSAMSVAQAQHSLQDANFSVTQSQYQLTIAWQQARFQLQELELQVSAASLNLRGAQLGLEQAQQNYAMVMAQSTSTALDRAQAAYQIQVAEQSLKQVTLQNSQNEQQLANVRKYGMQQVFGVTAAQHALADAQFAQVQSQKQLIVTEKEAANAQIVAAHAIVDAIYGVQQARFSQTQGAITSAHSIVDAQFQVLQSQEQLKLAAQAGGAAAVSAYNAFQVALADLSPAARKAVKALEPIFLWWQQNSKAQQAFFGQFNSSLTTLGRRGIGIIAPLNHMLDAIAATLGKVGARFLDWFAHLANSPIWRYFTNTSVSILRSLGTGALEFAKGIEKIAIAAAPLARWLGRTFQDWGKEFKDWATQQLRPGSILHVLLHDAKPALEALGQLAKSILLSFEILAGGRANYNKKTGVLESVTPTDSQNSAFSVFLALLAALSNVWLPKLATLLNTLAQPRLANALINLVSALVELAVHVLTAPGFLAAFILFTNTFATLVNWLGEFAALPGVGQTLGTIASALLALSLIRFAGSGVSSLFTAIGKVAGWVKSIASASGIFGKIGAILGSDRGGGAIGGAITTAGDKAAGAMGDAITAAGEKAAASMAEAIRAAGGVAAAEEQAGVVRGGAGAATEEAAGASGFLSRFKGAPGILGALGAAGVLWAVNRRGGIPGIRPMDPGQTIWQSGSPPPPGGRQTGWNSWAGLGDNFKQWGKDFAKNVFDPVKHFFTNTLPGWFGMSSKDWMGLWRGAWSFFQGLISGNFTTFFSQSVPGWFGDLAKFWSTLWSENWNLFDQDILTPAAKFFTRTIPGWFDQVASWFHDKVATPLASFFTKTLPSAIEGAFKNSVNWVITNILNKVIGWINDATKLVGLPKIGTIQTLASGGAAGYMTPQGGGPRQDNRLVRVSDGEFVVNAEATRRHRPLIEALNASTGSHAGPSGLAGGGGVGGFFSGLWGDITHSAGSIWSTISGLFSGGSSILSKLKDFVLADGVKPVVDAMWSHLVTPLLGAAGINAGTETSLVPHLVAFLAGDMHAGLDKLLTSMATPGGPAGKGFGKQVATPGNVVNWLLTALKLTHSPSSWLSGEEIIAKYESGDNPNAQNNWDSNAAAGDPSRGLMQTIMTTFDAYHQSGTSWNIFDPIANAAASINYQKSRYGTVWNVPGVKSVLAGGPYVGYASGGFTGSAAALLKAYAAEQKAYKALSKIHARGSSRDAGQINRRVAAAGKRQSAIATALGAMQHGLSAGRASWLTGADWTALSGATGTFLSELTGSQRGWHTLRSKDASVVGPFITALRGLSTDEKAAWDAWRAVAPSATPGAVAAPPVSSPYVPDVYSLIPHGPVPAYAGGGYVPDLSGMFGFAQAPGLPGMALPSIGVPASQASRPGVLAGTAAPGGGRTVNFGAITIHNPVPSRAGDSVTREVQRAAFLAGRNIV